MNHVKILEFMSFNPSWFLTLPGILITSGVVLLLIALILLITSGNKETENTEKTQQPQVASENAVDAFAQVAVPEVPLQTQVNDIPVTSVQPEQVNTISNVANNVDTLDIPQATPVTSNVETQNIAEVDSVPVSKVPEIEIFEPEKSVATEPTIPLMQEVASDVNATPIINSIPNVTESISNINIEPQKVSEAKPTVSIYGGVSPTVDLYKAEQSTPTKPVIYGGADPLENTAPIPKVESRIEPSPMPAPASINSEVKLVDPVATPEVIAPTAIVDNSVNDAVVDTSSVSSLIDEAVSGKPIVSNEIETLDF